MSIATVMGPTPPGTGVMWLATLLTDSKLQSPTRRCPDFLVESTRNGTSSQSVCVQQHVNPV